MEFLQLRYFYESAQTENFAKTARKFMVPASCVSASIKRLEKELGADLFDRFSNRIILNDKGRLFAKNLEQIFDKLENTVDEITQSKSETKEIFILIKARRKWITDLIIEYKKTHPEVQFRIYNDIHVDDTEEFDVIVDEQSDAYTVMERFLLSVEEICIKSTKDSLLANKKLTFYELKDQPFVMPGKAIGIRKLLEATGKKHGFVPNIAIECNDSYCLTQYVKAGMGLALGSRRALQSDLEKNLVALDVIDFCEVQTVYVYHRKLHGNDTVLKDFCDFLYKKGQKLNI